MPEGISNNPQFLKLTAEQQKAAKELANNGQQDIIVFGNINNTYNTYGSNMPADGSSVFNSNSGQTSMAKGATREIGVADGANAMPQESQGSQGSFFGGMFKGVGKIFGGEKTAVGRFLNNVGKGCDSAKNFMTGKSNDTSSSRSTNETVDSSVNIAEDGLNETNYGSELKDLHREISRDKKQASKAKEKRNDYEAKEKGAKAELKSLENQLSNLKEPTKPTKPSGDDKKATEKYEAQMKEYEQKKAEYDKTKEKLERKIDKKNKEIDGYQAKIVKQIDLEKSNNESVIENTAKLNDLKSEMKVKRAEKSKETDKAGKPEVSADELIKEGADKIAKDVGLDADPNKIAEGQKAEAKKAKDLEEQKKLTEAEAAQAEFITNNSSYKFKSGDNPTKVAKQYVETLKPELTGNEKQTLVHQLALDIAGRVEDEKKIQIGTEVDMKDAIEYLTKKPTDAEVTE